MQKQVQKVIAVSANAKQAVKDYTVDFGGPSKSKDYLAASEREVIDGLICFTEANRYEVVTQEIAEIDSEGNPVLDSEGNPLFTTEEIEIDLFEKVMNRIIAERMDITHTRTNTDALKVRALETERAELLAKIAAFEAGK